MLSRFVKDREWVVQCAHTAEPLSAAAGSLWPSSIFVSQ